MREETVLLISRLADCSGHPLAKHVEGDMFVNAPVEEFYYKPLKQVFSRVLQYDCVARMTEIGFSGINEELIALVRKEKPRYVLWMSSMYEVTAATFDAIRREGATIIGWFNDDEYRFAFYHQWWLPHVDYCVTHDLQSVERYRALGARPVFAFPCEGTPVEKDWSKVEENYEVSFVGRKSKSMRGDYIYRLEQEGIAVNLFGRGWEHGYVTTGQMLDIFGTSKINLNFSGTGNRKGIKARIAIVCLAGGFLLTEYAPGLERFFEIGKELAVFKDAAGMVDQIRYYLAHDEERRAVARAGWERAVKEYTPARMIARVFDEVEADIAGGTAWTPPPVRKRPWTVRNAYSQYYFQWGRAYASEGCDDLARDALRLALAQNSLNLGARYYTLAGHFPRALRGGLFGLYRPFHGLSRWFVKLRLRLYRVMDALPGVNNLKKAMSRKLSYS